MLNRPKKIAASTNMFFNVALEFSSGILVGVVLGWGLDKLFATKPIFIILGLGFGFAASMINVYRYIKKNL